MKNNHFFLPANAVYFTLLLFITNTNLFAQTTAPAVDCGCTITLPKAADGGIYSNGSAVKPGSKVCIAAGTYKYINLSNYHGTAAAPIQFINCGGQVNITGLNYGFSIASSSFFSFTGTGTAGITYGFVSTGGSTYSGIGMGIGASSDFTIDHIDISKTTVGMMCKTNPTCDPSTWQAAFIMKNLVFHDIHVHDVLGEGFYIGHTSNVVTLTCNGTATSALPQKINGLRIYKCLVETTGWDGIQVAGAPVDAQVYNNTVLNFGTKNQSSQQAGILFGGITNGKVYNNYVNNGTGNGIQVFGVGYLQIYNNLVVNVGGNNVVSASKDGIFMDDRPVAGYPAPYYTVCNNTVVSPKRSGIRLENTYKTVTTKSEFHNNLVVASGEPDPNFTNVVIRNNAPNSSTANLYVATVSAAKFVSSTDYHLTSSSPAVNEGIAVSSWGILTDKDGLSRSVGASPDGGAYEYSGTGSGGTANSVPVANGGVDQTITLPTSSVTLAGSGTDGDGTVTKYAWTQVSGPSQSVISNAAVVNPKVSGLVAGTYTIRLTVTDNDMATGFDDMLIIVNPALGSTYVPVPAKIEAETYAAMSGIKTEPTKDVGGGSDISWVHYGDWMDYNVNVTSAGTYTVNLRLACYVNTGQLQLQKGSTILSTVNVPNTGGYQTWKTISTTVSLLAGNQTLRVYSSSTGAWFLNWLEFVKSASLVMSNAGQSGEISEGLKSVLTFRVFPNPVYTSLNLQMNKSISGAISIKLVDASGNIIKDFKITRSADATQIKVPVKELSAGVYYVQVQTTNGKGSERIVKL